MEILVAGSTLLRLKARPTVFSSLVTLGALELGVLPVELEIAIARVIKLQSQLPAAGPMALIAIGGL